jgi:hypothetical protein
MMLRVLHGVRMVFSTSGAGMGPLSTTCKLIKQSTHLTPHTKINLKGIKDLSVKKKNSVSDRKQRHI